MSLKIILTGTILLLSFVVQAQISVLTKHNDLARSGWNKWETSLKPSNVNARQFGKIFSVPIDDNTYAQVLILSKINIGGGIHNLAIAATTNNTIYAFDADNGNVFWSKNFTPVGLRVVYHTDFAKCEGGTNNDISRSVGIVGTPVIDSITQTLYFVARGTDADTSGIGNYYTYLHAVNIKTGHEKSNSPVLISGSVSGTGPDAVNGVIPFNPQHQNQRLALALYNGTVLVGFSSHCDWLPYHGWIFGYNAATLTRKIIYNSTPDANGGGIWESGGGISIDNNGYMYIVTGNGEDGGIGKDGNPLDLSNRAQSAIKLKITDTALIPVDFFTPSNYKTINYGADLDYGSMASFLIPNSHFYFTGAKDGNIYILNTNDMGSFHASGDQIAQFLGLGTSVFMRCSPGYYRSQKNEFVYVWSEQSQLKAIPFNRNTDRFDIEQLKTGLISIDNHSANISTSSNNLHDGTGIVWISRPAAYSSQILSALDANDITKELWNSTQNLKRDSCGGFMKFAVPTIANGKVYLANSTGSINVYGIIDSIAQLPDCSASTILSAGLTGFASGTINNSHSSAKAFDLNLGTQWTSSSSSEQWLGVNFGSIDSVCSVSIQWDSLEYATNFLLQVSKDSATWKTVKSITGNNSTYNSYSIKASGKFVRIYCTAGNSSKRYSIQELTVYGRMIASCETPKGLTVNLIDTNSAVIRWNLVNKANAYTVKFKTQSSSVWQSFNTSSDSLHVTGLSCNTYYQYAARSKCNTDTSLISQTGEFNTQGCENCILPTRTNQTDIGDVGIPGQGCYFKPNNYTINSSGTDIGNSTDAFHFVYKDFSGDGNVEVRIVGLDLVDPLNKAGIMFREDLSADARSVFIGVTSSKKIMFISRKSKGSNAITVTRTGYSIPCYVKIVKEGQVYSGYVSLDSTNWDLVGSTTNKMSSTGINVGLAVTSHNNTELSNAKFKNFIVNSTGFSTKQSLLARSAVNTAIIQPQDLKIFPNPANKSFSVDFYLETPENAVISIIEIGTGRIVFKENVLNFSGRYHKLFTDAIVPRGTYIIALKTGKDLQTKQFQMK